jgi:hypothetical protein
MFDGAKILAGLVVFGTLTSCPIWYNALTGKTGYVPQPRVERKPQGTGQCIEPRDYIRLRHKELLTGWRDSVVRLRNRVYVASDGKEYEMSLIRTCIGCHSNSREEFCNQCHNYLGISNATKCWECHAHPREVLKRADGGGTSGAMVATSRGREE